MLYDFVFCTAGGKSPHQTEPSQHLYKHTALGLQKARAILPPLLLPFSSFNLPFFSPFLIFYKLSLLLTDVTAVPLYFILSSPSVTSQAQLLLLGFSWVSQSCWTWDGASVLPHLLSFSHHFIHCLTSMWVKWSISTCWLQQPSQEWLKSLSKENIHATIYFSKVYLERKKKGPNFLGNE